MQKIARYSSIVVKSITSPPLPAPAIVFPKPSTINDVATTGPRHQRLTRFEQTNWEFQPNPPSAMELIAKVPVTMVHDRKTSCNGGGGALGHPRVYLNLSLGQRTCGYCGLRFQQDH